MDGPCRIVKGDCLEVLPTLPAGLADAAILDPPYGVDFKGRWNSDWGGIKNDGPALGWLWPLARELARVTADDAFAVVFYGWPEAGKFLDAFGEAGWRPTSHLCFVKNQMGLGYHTRSAHEVAYLFAKGSPSPHEVGEDVLPFTRVRNPRHPNQKPTDAIMPLVRRFSPPGGLVVDPFGGSGTTAVCCRKLGRRCVIIEDDERFIPVIRSRVDEAEHDGFQLR